MKIKYLIFFVGLCISATVYSITENIDQYWIYQSDYSKKTGKENFAVYMIKNDPCLYVSIFQKNKITRYCNFQSIGKDLEKNGPYNYATNIYIKRNRVYFIITNSQYYSNCYINVFNNTVYCKENIPPSTKTPPDNILGGGNVYYVPRNEIWKMTKIHKKPECHHKGCNVDVDILKGPIQINGVTLTGEGNIGFSLDKVKQLIFYGGSRLAMSDNERQITVKKTTIAETAP